MNNEILSKARQLAQIKNEPEGSCDISKLSVALEMADWMKETMIEKAVQYLQSVPHSKPMFWSIDDFRKKWRNNNMEAEDLKSNWNAVAPIYDCPLFPEKCPRGKKPPCSICEETPYAKHQYTH